MTLKDNRAPLSYMKLCASFHHHMWIQTGVTVRKRLNGHDLCNLDLWPWPFAWTSLMSLVTTPENFMMIRWEEYCEKGVTGRRTDRQTEITALKSCLVAAKKWTWIPSSAHGFITLGSCGWCNNYRTYPIWLPSFMNRMIHNFAFLAFGKSDRAKVWSLHILAEIATPEFNQPGSITIILSINIYQNAPYFIDRGSWNTSSWKTMAYLFYIVNIDGLAKQGAWTSATMLLIMLYRINLILAC